MKRVVINPVTRISGFMELDVFIENHEVKEALTKGMLFRGFEQMMVGRNPFDVIYLTQRICGICSAAHSVAASLALENALGVQPTEQGIYLRDLIHCCEFLQNHLRHFYQYSIPDFVKMPDISPLQSLDHQDFRLPKSVNDRIAQHYFESLGFSRLAHQILAVFGGKAPHNHGVFVGGISRPPATDQIIEMKSMLAKIKTFIDTKMLEDVYTIAKYYPELFQMGGGHGNFLCYGAFVYKELGNLYVEPKVYIQGKMEKFDPGQITENIDYSWYEGKSTYRPLETMPEPEMEKKKAYTWVKAPRYRNQPCEVGPLARLWLSGEYRRGISAMDRTIARVLEAQKITRIMEVLLDNIIPNISVQKEWKIPDSATGAGYVETTRGSLAHWLKIENKKISFYQIITPSAWDFSARDEYAKGTAEQALIGATVQNPDQPVELGRIIRSFDPCMSCATHVYQPGKEPITVQVFG